MLRRTKEHLNAETAGETIGKALPSRLESFGSMVGFAKLLPSGNQTFAPRFVVWLSPSRDQVRTYRKALETSDIIHEAN